MLVIGDFLLENEDRRIVIFGMQVAPGQSALTLLSH